jgi:hypothetical protein
MDRDIFSGFGIRIRERGGKFYLEYDAGHLEINMREIEISFADSQKAQSGERGAYEVILDNS